MNTVIKVINYEDETENKEAIDLATVILKSGGLVAFPTETVYGLGANALNPLAVSEIYKAKGRPCDNPLILHISQISDLEDLTTNISVKAKTLAENFWPGPLTIIFHKTDIVPLESTGGLDTVAVRFPACKIARRLIKECGFPIAAPSANSSGKPSPTKSSHVEFDLGGKIDMIIDGGICELGIESTIIDATVEPPCILRPGSITREMIEDVIGAVDVDRHFAIENEKTFAPKSPGMKYTHYSPLADVLIVKGELDNVVRNINLLAERCEQKVGIMATDQTKNRYDCQKFKVISVGDRDCLETVTVNLFSALRRFDFEGVDQIFAESFSEEGLGFSIMNRLKKAAGNRILIAGNE